VADAAATKEAKKVSPGKSFAFNLTGDDFHLYETARDTYQAEADGDDETVAAALDCLDDDVRALVEARFAPRPAKRELSQRQLFVRVMQDAQKYRDYLADQEENGAVTGGTTEDAE
jgi:ketosteroid isomerase-like protein